MSIGEIRIWLEEEKAKSLDGSRSYDQTIVTTLQTVLGQIDRDDWR